MAPPKELDHISATDLSSSVFQRKQNGRELQSDWTPYPVCEAGTLSPLALPTDTIVDKTSTSPAGDSPSPFSEAESCTPSENTANRGSSNQNTNGRSEHTASMESATDGAINIFGDSRREDDNRHKHRIALLALDLQNDFLGEDDPQFFLKKKQIGERHPFAGRRTRLINRIRELSEQVQDTGGVIFFIQSMYQSLSARGQSCIIGTKGADLHPEAVELMESLQKRGACYRLVKLWYSAFLETCLHALFRKMGVDIVIITGLTTNHSVAATIRSANYLGYPVYLSYDGTAQIDAHLHEESLQRLQAKFCNVLPAGACIPVVDSNSEECADMEQDILDFDGCIRLSGLGAGDCTILPDIWSLAQANILLNRLLNCDWGNEREVLFGSAEGDQLVALLDPLRQAVQKRVNHPLNWCQLRRMMSLSESREADPCFQPQPFSHGTYAAIVSLGECRILEFHGLFKQSLYMHHNSILLVGYDTMRQYEALVLKRRARETRSARKAPRIAVVFGHIDENKTDRMPLQSRVAPVFGDTPLSDGGITLQEDRRVLTIDQHFSTDGNNSLRSCGVAPNKNKEQRPSTQTGLTTVDKSSPLIRADDSVPSNGENAKILLHSENSAPSIGNDSSQLSTSDRDTTELHAVLQKNCDSNWTTDDPTAIFSVAEPDSLQHRALAFSTYASVNDDGTETDEDGIAQPLSQPCEVTRGMTEDARLSCPPIPPYSALAPETEVKITNIAAKAWEGGTNVMNAVMNQGVPCQSDLLSTDTLGLALPLDSAFEEVSHHQQPDADSRSSSKESSSTVSHIMGHWCQFDEVEDLGALVQAVTDQEGIHKNQKKEEVDDVVEVRSTTIEHGSSNEDASMLSERFSQRNLALQINQHSNDVGSSLGQLGAPSEQMAHGCGSGIDYDKYELEEGSRGLVTREMQEAENKNDREKHRVDDARDYYGYGSSHTKATLPVAMSFEPNVASHSPASENQRNHSFSKSKSSYDSVTPGRFDDSPSIGSDVDYDMYGYNTHSSPMSSHRSMNMSGDDLDPLSQRSLDYAQPAATNESYSYDPTTEPSHYSVMSAEEVARVVGNLSLQSLQSPDYPRRNVVDLDDTGGMTTIFNDKLDIPEISSLSSSDADIGRTSVKFDNYVHFQMAKIDENRTVENCESERAKSTTMSGMLAYFRDKQPIRLLTQSFGPSALFRAVKAIVDYPDQPVEIMVYDNTLAATVATYFLIIATAFHGGESKYPAFSDAAMALAVAMTTSTCLWLYRTDLNKLRAEAAERRKIKVMTRQRESFQHTVQGTFSRASSATWTVVSSLPKVWISLPVSPFAYFPSFPRLATFSKKAEQKVGFADNQCSDSAEYTGEMDVAKYQDAKVKLVGVYCIPNKGINSDGWLDGQVLRPQSLFSGEF